MELLLFANAMFLAPAGVHTLLHTGAGGYGMLALSLVSLSMCGLVSALGEKW